MPADTVLKYGLGWSHPSDWKSSTGMVGSFLWKSRELIDKAVDIVPANLDAIDTRICWWGFVDPVYPGIISFSP